MAHPIYSICFPKPNSENQTNFSLCRGEEQAPASTSVVSVDAQHFHLHFDYTLSGTAFPVVVRNQISPIPPAGEVSFLVRRKHLPENIGRSLRQ